MKRNKSQVFSPATPSLLLAGGASILLANPATAVELAEIQVQSALGQPLRASIAFALAPNEQINDQCVYLNAATSGQGLPVVSRATATVSGRNILLRGDIPLREPMMSLQLAVNCAYTAKVSREYLLLLSPASASTSAIAPATTETSNQASATPKASGAPAAAPVADQRRPVNTYVAPRVSTPARAAATPVAAGSEYRVRVGDTLSEIASRIPDRKVGLWNAVDRIFSANPDAFINNDMNQLIAGTTLQIPASVTDGSRVATAAAAERTPATSSSSRTRAYTGAAAGQTAPEVAATAPVASPAAVAPAALVEPPPVEQATEVVDAAAADSNEFDAGTSADSSAYVVDAAIESAAPAEPPVVATPEPAPQVTVSIPDTRIEQQQPVPVAAVDNESGASSWLVWLGGTGIAIFLALLLFGRRFREKFTDAPEQALDLDETMVSDVIHGAPTDLTETIGRANALQVTEDLTNNEVFDTGDDLDVALDYSFASSGDHSKELDFIVEGDEPDNAELATREMPSAAQAATEEDEYDMSMVLDVTKQDFQSPRIAMDLQATEVNPQQTGTVKSRSRDLTTEFDYRILEQDYEDELTATQALSREVEIAARDLQKRLADVEPDASNTSMAEDIEVTAEITAEMPYRALNDDSEDTEETLSLTPSEETDLTEALAASMDELDFDIDDDDETAVLSLEDTPKQRRSKAG